MRNYRGKDIEKIKKRDADEWWKNWRSICRRNRRSFLSRYTGEKDNENASFRFEFRIRWTNICV